MTGCGAATEPEREPPGPPLPARWEHGLDVTAYERDAFSWPRAARAIADARTRAGATVVAIAPVLYVDDARDSTVAPDPRKTVTPAGVQRAVRAARDAGVQVAVKPHVDALDGTFRGALQPVDRVAWFASYSRELLAYARAAQAAGATTFVVGTELTSLALREAEWRSLIAAVRRVFRGRLTYAANWVQGAERVRFWDALDVVGVDAYMPLDVRGRPTPEAVRDAWAPWKARLAALHRRTGRDVLLTELGYASRTGALAEPSREEGGAPDGGALQAVAYEGALRAWEDVPWLRGIWWWDWPADQRVATAPPAIAYTPRDRPAERVLRTWAPRP
ncbi:hypothetical protein [Conexibacter sp. SYSU D00693]|uniref:glycoside hydrolase family 113 n=1 Tax=Conexibacter sp. SYSU D00693 TaxID=2812560 RepID=UPI00196AFCA2|nr:hypothetical protein [Conexibacter sp. SYSU D00693]